jgi:hypothetical protein
MASLDLKELDFFVVKEDYSRFVLNDGTTIKAKVLLRKIFASPINTPEGYPTETAFDAMNVVVALVPQNLKRQPSQETFNPQVDRGEEISFIEQKVNTQEYVTDNGLRILIRPVPTKVFRYNKYNALGEPVYNVVVQQITNMEKMQSTSG